MVRRVMADTGDRIAAIRVHRERFGLDLRQSKEVKFQAEGTAPSLDEHQERLAEAVERALREQGERPGEAEKETFNKIGVNQHGLRQGQG